MKCPICNLPLNQSVSNVDMHEAIVTRGDVQGTKVADHIFHRCNSVHVHQHCHTPGHMSEENWRKCVDYLVEWEGRLAIEEWLLHMSVNTKIVGQQALQRFNVYVQENEAK